MVAATNPPAASSILWQDFLDNKKPQWFLDLPSDIQSYLIREYGPTTAWLTTTSATQSSDSSTSRAPSTTSTSSQTSSPTSEPVAPAASKDGLTTHQKIGIGFGVGIPLGLLVIAAVLFACCFLCRRRHKKSIEGSEPPSSPGFIPRFSFQERHVSSEYLVNNRTSRSSQDAGIMNWEDDGYDPAEWGVLQRGHTFPAPASPMAMHDAEPIMRPALYHTHSSNRARGTRTSYTSLRSVAEVSEPDEEMRGSPGLAQQPPLPPRQTLRRLSQPLHMEVPPVLAAAALKRRPVSTGVTGTGQAAEAPPRSFSRPLLTMPDNRGSNSSGLPVSTASSSSGLGNHTGASTPISPISNHTPKNPFAGGYDYLEDYGPEYSNNSYVDLEDGLYGGHRSLDRYPSQSPTGKSSKTEWPLRNVIGSSPRRNKSPLWDRVYEKE